MKINLIRSETWEIDNFLNIRDILDETIRDCVTEKDEIINIEAKEQNGLFRFWIYLKSND
jgi:hypothetical protein